MFLLELALVLPVVILGGTSLIDTVSILRTQNALKEAAQASLRCLTTINSPCTAAHEQDAATRQFTYYRVTKPPTLYGNLKQVPAHVEERVAPLERYQFDATVLDTLYSATGQLSYEEIAYQYSSLAEVSYVRERYGYYLDYVSGTASHRVVVSEGDATAVTPSLETSYSSQPTVRRNQSANITFRIPRPNALRQFDASRICVTGPITNGDELPPGCMLSLQPGKTSSRLLTSMMILLEGRAAGGSSSAKMNAQVTMTASYVLDGKKTEIPLGGQQFELNGTRRREDFVPRGAPAGTLIEERYGPGLVDKTSKYYDGELSAYSADKLILPFDTPITIQLTFKTKGIPADASWQPSRLAVYLPTFDKKATTLTCTNAPSCAELSKDTSSCTTSPKLTHGITAVRPVKRIKATPEGAPTACRANAPTPNPEDPRFKLYTIGGVACVNRAIHPRAGTSCPTLTTARQCASSNKGVAVAPDQDGLIRAPSSELEAACNSPVKPTESTLPPKKPIMPGESVATVKRFRVTSSSQQPVESVAFKRSCDMADRASIIPRPPEVQPYQQTTPILVGTVAGQVQPLPADMAASNPEALACFPTRLVDPQQTPRLLGDYAFLLTPHPDRGCGYDELLQAAQKTVEADSRFQLTFGSPQTTNERFAFDPNTKPDECQLFTVGTPELAPESLELIGTFSEATPPQECRTNRCVREFAGLLEPTVSPGPSVNIARAVAEAKVAYHAYLPNREPDDLIVSITQPTGTGDKAESFSVSTQLTVPLSFHRQSTIAHVAHGEAEVDGDE